MKILLIALVLFIGCTSKKHPNEISLRKENWTLRNDTIYVSGDSILNPHAIFLDTISMRTFHRDTVYIHDTIYIKK